MLHISHIMRSLTQSSASNSATTPYPLPAMHPHTLPTPIPASQVDNPESQNTVRTRLPPTTSSNSFFNVSDRSLLLSPQVKGHINQAIQGSWTRSTMRRYSGAISQFIQFCDKEHVPESLRFPADEFILCAFAASSLGRHAGSTPRSRISALKAWHSAHNVEWKGSSRLRLVLNGVSNLAPGSSKRPPRPPINARMVSQLVEALNINSPLDAAVAACATTAFWGQCRLGELLPLSLAVSPSTLFPTRSDFKRSLRNPQSCLLCLPRTKTHRDGQEVVLVDQQAPVNPISLLKNHLRVNAVPNNDYIFSYMTADGRSFLTKSLFLQRCNTIWNALGYPRTTGHSFRINGTTELLIAGTPPDVVKVTGRWSSEAFLKYWRSLDDIAPQYIRNVHRPRHKRRHS